jgi:hypothetical protein
VTTDAPDRVAVACDEWAQFTWCEHYANSEHAQKQTRETIHWELKVTVTDTQRNNTRDGSTQ